MEACEAIKWWRNPQLKLKQPDDIISYYFQTNVEITQAQPTSPAYAVVIYIHSTVCLSRGDAVI